mmetsp:Transcript_42846/g.79355  ORF Transcript_42846/g.79355 Transcript_42846/m.79355 type:complete len:208 (+) Transcript_42846:720-1343(+)
MRKERGGRRRKDRRDGGRTLAGTGKGQCRDLGRIGRRRGKSDPILILGDRLRYGRQGVVHEGGDLLAYAVGRELDVLAEELAHALGARAEAELVLRSVLGPAQVRAHRDDGALLLQELDGRDGGTDAGVIGDGLAVEGGVHVAPNQNLLALEVVGDVLDGLLGHVQLSQGRSADAELGRGREGRSGGGGGGEGHDDGGDELHLGVRN